jgi:hypothetical protein
MNMERLKEFIVFQAEQPQPAVMARKPFVQSPPDEAYVTQRLSQVRAELQSITALRSNPI